MNMDSKELIEAYLVYGIDPLNRRIFMFEDVDSVSIGRVIKGLYLMDSLNNQPIEVFIGSLGGDVYEAYGLYDVVRTLKSPVHTVAIGKCMSAAPLLVACGEKGHRYATPNTWFMVHKGQACCGNGERVESREIELHHQKAIDKQWYRLMAKHTNKDANFWNRMCNKVGDTYFSAADAVEWGIADQLWDEKDDE